MTITADAQMWQAYDQIENLHRAIASLRSEGRPMSARNLAVLAEGPLDQLRQLQAEIDSYMVSSVADSDPKALWIGLVGAHLRLNDAPTSVLTAILDTFRKGVQTVAEVLSKGQLSARPTALLKRACDFRIVGFAPGSLRICVRLPEPDQIELGHDASENPAESALGEYLRVASWAASDREEADLAMATPDSRLRRIVLTELSRLVPRQRGEVESVELYGAALTNAKPIRLVRGTRERIHRAIDSLVVETPEAHSGVLREIDLDECTFILRDINAPDVHCEFEEDLLESAKEALDRRVEVTGKRKTSEGRRMYAKLSVTRLEIVEEEAPADTAPAEG